MLQDSPNRDCGRVGRCIRLVALRSLTLTFEPMGTGERLSNPGKKLSELLEGTVLLAQFRAPGRVSCKGNGPTRARSQRLGSLWRLVVGIILKQSSGQVV